MDIRRISIVLVGLLAIGFPFMVGGDEYVLHVSIVTMITIIMTMTVRMQFAAGIFQCGHAVFLAIGAYASSLLAVRLSMSPWLGILAAGILAGVIAGLIGLPTLRLLGVYFGLASFAFLQVVRIILQNWEGFTMGARGVAGIPTLDVGGYEFSDKPPFYYLVLVLLAAVLLFMMRLDRSRFGMTLRSVEQNLELSQSVGVHPLRYKLITLVISGVVAGVAGAILAHYLRYISPPIASMWTSFYYVVYSVIGGISSPIGPLLGAGLLGALPYFLSDVREYETIILGVVLFIIVFTRPKGLVDFAAPLCTISDKVATRFKGFRHAARSEGDHEAVWGPNGPQRD